MKPAFTFILCVVFFNLTAQNRLYVNHAATGLNNGQSWTDAFQDLQNAIQTAQMGNEIWVAEGIYRPTGTQDRNISFEPLSGVGLYGGFAGIENELSQRDWVAHPTVLSGDIGVAGDSTDNSYNVVYMFEPDSNTMINGFFIRDGVADEQTANPFFRTRSGGGIYIMGENGYAYPEIRNCVFLHNTAVNYGGGVMVYGGNNGSVAPRMVNCRFEANFAGGYGGGLSRIGGSLIERGDDLADCVFYQNRSGYRGGGFYYRDNERKDILEINGCIFKENRALDDGGGAYMAVGRQNPSGYSIIGTSFISNVADDGAAFVMLPQGFGYGSFFKMDSCVFEKNIHAFNNTPDPAVAKIDFLASDAIVQIRHCTFIENSNWPYLFRSLIGSIIGTTDVFLEDILLEKNKECGSLITINGANNAYVTRINVLQNSNFISPFGFGVFNNVVFENCLIAKNNSSSASYFYSVSNLDSFLLRNCSFIENNIGQVSTNTNQEIKIATNCILNNIGSEQDFLNTENYGEFSHCSFDAVNCAGLGPYITCGPGNLIGLAPLFRNPAAGDYSLLPCSPLINVGSNAAAMGILTDIAGNPRIQGGTVDIGAYEAPAFALAASPQVQPACEGSSNGSIAITPVFGCEPYTYNWLPDAGNGPQLNGLPPGNYLLTITDGSGRQILDTVQVVSAPLPVLNPLVTDVQCGTTLGGSIAANVSNGTAPFHYQWQPLAADTSLLTRLSPGAYSLTVSDANGCQDSTSASISLLGLLALMVDGQGISCFGETDGWLSATPLTGASPFYWDWQGWAGTDSVAQPLGPGLYAVTVSDVFGCTAAFTFPPTNQPDSLYATVGTQDQTNLTMPNGAAVVTTISGGMAPYGFDWSTGSTQQAIAGLTAGDYIVTVTDKNGCEFVVEVVVDLMVSSTEAIEGQAFVVYPNPAADWLKVVFSQPIRGGMLELSDASGRVLRSIQLAAESVSCTMDLSGLPSGSYVATLRSSAGKERFVGKVLKH